LKDMFGRIQTNPDNRHSDGSFGCVVTTSQPGTLDAVGGRPPQHCEMGPGLRREDEQDDASVNPLSAHEH
jgi:hypothetical protein